MTRFIRYCIGIVICLFFVLPQLEAQQINYAEYFFDNDPGYGNGTSLTITQNNTIDANFSISTSSLSLGIHKLYVRTKSTTGEWSLCNYRLLYIRETASNSQIVAAEYFIDTDPGMGNATSVSLTAGDTITINQSISTASISPGIHYLYVRVKNAANRWSLIAPRLIYVIANQTTNLLVAAEYYFDNDPGHGNATSLAVTAGDTINVTSNISVASLSPGIHFLNVRARDASGKWSLSEQKMIFKSESITNGQISQAEYFYDNDPGLGNATSITITAGDTVNFTSLLSTTGLSAGIHNLNIRVKNGNGRWSLNSKRMIYVMAGNLSSPKITDAEYFFDTDPGFGNGTAFSITAGNTIDLTSVIASSSLSLGHHQLYVRAKDSLGRWSLNDKRLVYISPTLASQKISAIEYTVDTVMPMGQGNIINITPTDSLDHVFSFVHNLTDTFYHVLYARVKDVGGRWSLFDSTIFKLENCILPTANFTLSDICFGDTAVFVNTSTSTDTSSVFEWGIMNNGSVESNNADSMIYGFSSPGTY
nr:hypothetical protein [Bacteroidota bacterium]